MKHYIQRQEVMIDIGPRSDAFRIQHAAAQYARNTLLPALDDIFNELSTEEVVIHIDRIYIDLGFLDETSLQSGILTSAMYQRIKEELRRVILGESPNSPVTQTSLRDNVLTQWWYYMEHGRLPWNSDRPDAKWYAKVLEMFSVDYPAITKLRTALQHKPRLRARISAQHRPEFLETLITVLTSSRQEQLSIAVEEFCRTLDFIGELPSRRLIGTPTPDEPQTTHAHHEMILHWTARLTEFLALPATERKVFVWNSLLEDAAAHPIEWAKGGGVESLLDRIWDSPPLMRLLAESFAGRDNLFIQRFNARYAAIRTTTGDEPASHLASHPDSPATVNPNGRTTEPATPNPANPIMANSPQLDLPRQSTPSTPTDGKELDLAIEEACRIIQFLADKYRELTSTTEQQQPRQNDAELKFLFIQWAGRMKDLLAVPANGRQDYIRRWLRDVAASASAKLAGKDTKTILLDFIWDSIPLMELILAEKATPDTGPILQLIHQRYNQKKTQPSGERPDNQTARKKVLKEEEFLFRSEEVSEESIYVPHAGIVLVHPFLSTFFSRLQLWDKTGFTDLYARQKAVYLLHYLATGERRGPEYDMVLPKLLCGYALEMPLPGDLLLGDEACAEGDLLLRNVLERWEKLKNSSIDALREGFLRRDGKLYTHNDRLCLQVEAGAIDVLLDFLPWNISLVKLPWLKDILYVEWR